MKTKLLLLLFVSCTFGIHAQIRSILVNPGTSEITIKNFGGSTVDISNYRLCKFPSYSIISSTTIVGGGDFNLSPNEEVTLTWSPILNETDGELGIYISTNWTEPNDMLDYMQWGFSGHQRESVADAKGIWTAGTAVTVTPPYQYTGDGTQNGASFWGTILSLNDFSANSFSITPNPAKTFIEINTNNRAFSKLNAKIMDLLGKTIVSAEYDLNSHIDISNLKSGVYLINLSSNKGSVTKRFIKL